MLLLRLYQPVDGPALLWVLRGADGQLLATGTEQTDWPVADQVELILAAGRTRFTRLVLPAGVSASETDALAFCLESGLLNPPGDNLYLSGALADCPGCVWVALTAALPLQSLLSRLRSQGISPDRIVPEEMLLPLPDNGFWAVSQRPDGWMIRQGLTEAGFLPTAAASLAASIRLPAAGLWLHGPVDLPPHWEQQPCQTTSAVDWRLASLDAGVNFACGALAPRRAKRQWQQAGRRVVLLLLLLCATEYLLSAAELGWQTWRVSRLRRAIVAEASGFGVPAGHADQPLRSAAAVLEQQRLQRGLPPRLGALQLMSALDSVAGDSLHLQHIDYRGQRLLLQAEPVAMPLLQRWRGRLSQQRLLLETNAAGQWLLRSAL